MPYYMSGSLKTDKQKINDSGGWDSQTDWEAYQSAQNVEIANGSVQLAEAPAIPDSGVSRWTFDDADTSGSTAIDVWGPYDGTINGATTGVAAHDDGEAYRFDGADDLVNCGTGPNLVTESAISFGCWFNTDDASTQQTLMSTSRVNNDVWDVRIGNGDIKVFITTDTDGRVGGTASVGYSAGAWYHIAATYDGANLRLYFDGAEAASTALSGSVANNDNDVLVGSFESGNLPFDGEIDDPRVYDKGLSDSEVSNWYSTGSIFG